MKRKIWSSLVLDRSQPVPLQVQLGEGLKSHIETGTMEAGAMLPSTRDLAREIGISRNTVVAAYDRLLGEGYLESRPRAGVFVCSGVDTQTGSKKIAERLGDKRRQKKSDRHFAVHPPKPFRPCQPDVGLFPLSLWNRMRNRELRKWGSNLLHYQSAFAMGWPGLRQALADYLMVSRGVQCNWRNIAITSGSQQALFLLGQLLIKPDSQVAMEDPGYLGARLAFEHAGARINSIPVDKLGTYPLPEIKRLKLIYTTPSRQYPTGATLSVARRRILIDWARQSRAWLLEDDYDSEFRYTRPPLPSLHSLDTSGQVIYLGSMSKVLLPTLRIGYVVLPEKLVASFEQLRLLVDDHGPMIDQAALAEFISQGGFYSHIRRCRKAYAARLEVFLQTARQLRLPLNFGHTDGGMNQTGIFLDPSVDDAAVAAALSVAGLDIHPLSRFQRIRKHGVPGLVFGFTAFEPTAIRTALKTVAQVIKELRIV